MQLDRGAGGDAGTRRAPRPWQRARRSPRAAGSRWSAAAPRPGLQGTMSGTSITLALRTTWSSPDRPAITSAPANAGRASMVATVIERGPAPPCGTRVPAGKSRPSIAGSLATLTILRTLPQSLGSWCGISRLPVRGLVPARRVARRPARPAHRGRPDPAQRTTPPAAGRSRCRAYPGRGAAAPQPGHPGPAPRPATCRSATVGAGVLRVGNGGVATGPLVAPGPPPGAAPAGARPAPLPGRGRPLWRPGVTLPAPRYDGLAPATLLGAGPGLTPPGTTSSPVPSSPPTPPATPGSLAGPAPPAPR